MRKQTFIFQPASGAGTSLLTRILVHASLLGACATLSGAALVWPQWAAVDGTRAALELQKEREGKLQERWDQVRALNERLSDWRHAQRRVLLEDEMGRYPLAVNALGKKCGVAAQAAVVNQPSIRWRPAPLTGTAWADADGADVGEIRPRSVKISVMGSFDGVYRTVATLCAQQQLFVPERWTLTQGALPGGGPGSAVRAEVTGVVFVLHQGEELP
jgi:hypothetical protein